MKKTFQLFLAGIIATGLSQPLLAADNSAVREKRGQEFIAALDPDRGIDWQAYIVENFTPEFISRRGANGLIGMMTMISGDVGLATLDSVEHSDNELELIAYSAKKDHWIAFNFTFDDSAAQLFSSFGATFIPTPLASNLAGLTEEELVEQIASYLSEKVSTDQFSGSVIVARHNIPLYAMAFGDADKRTRRKNTLDTPINLGSMNKMFTALAVAQLVEDGKLSYADKVGDYLPDYPNETVRNEVTIHQLLSHTSGLGSYWDDKWEQRKDQIRTVAEIASLFADEPLEQQPGAGFIYSNGGPTVLGLIIEKISGIGYYDYIRQNVYRSAGMVNSDHYLKNDDSARFALGYEKNDSGAWENNINSLGLIGGPAGGGYASANDLLRYSAALVKGEIVAKEHVNIVTSGKIRLSPDFAYGYGFGDHKIAGQRYFGHDGGAPGINAEFSIFPELGYTVIVLANYGHAATPVADHLRQMIAHSQQ